MRQFRKGDAPPEGGELFRKKTVVRMWRMDEPFECESREGTLVGQPGDFVVEDGHGGFYPVSAEFHAANYVEAGAGDVGSQAMLDTLRDVEAIVRRRIAMVCENRLPPSHEDLEVVADQIASIRADWGLGGA